MNVKVFDISGKFCFLKQKVENQVDIGRLQNGVYLLKLETEKGVVTKRIVKQ